MAKPHANPPAYKATARTHDGFSLTGYGPTPKAAAAHLVGAMPPRWREHPLQAVEIRRGDGTGAYPFTTILDPPVAAAAFWALGIRASARREWTFGHGFEV